MGSARAPVAVLVHGWVVSSIYMIPLMKALRPRWKVLAPDLGGFGRTRSQRILSTEELGYALACWLDEQGLKDVTLIGHSYGCQIATQAALSNPAAVSNLVFIGPTGETGMSRLGLVFSTARRFWLEPWWFWFVAAWDLLHFGPRRAWVSLNHLISHDMLSRFSTLKFPTTIIRGEYDGLCSHKWAEQLAGDKPVITIEGHAHVPHARSPERIANQINRLLP